MNFYLKKTYLDHLNIIFYTKKKIVQPLEKMWDQI
jgi:hypothetical protein